MCEPSRSACFSYSRLNFRKYGAEAELRALRDHLPGGAADNGANDGAGNLADLVFLRLGRLRRAVPQDDVAQLVRHDARDFTLRLRRGDHPAVDEHRAAREREGVDVARVHHLERIAELGVLEFLRNGLHEPAANALDVRLDLGIVEQGHLLPDFRRRFLPDLDVLRGREAVLRRSDARLRRRGHAVSHEREGEQRGERRGSLFS